jgi:hypothetical protein
MVYGALIWSAAAQAETTERAPAESVRSDESCSRRADLRCNHEPVAASKHIPPASPDRFLSLGGEWRIRGEYARNPDFGLDVSEDRALLQRILLHADLRLDPSTRVFVQLGSHVAVGRESGDGPTDEDGLDLAQAFVDLSDELGSGRLTVRVGRQETSLGSSRLVSVRESPNVRRAFDGVRAFWRSGDVSIDALYLRPVELERGVFDDRTAGSEAIYGVYLTAPLIPTAGANVDLYYLNYNRKRARFAQGTASERRISLGARLFGKRHDLDWDIEAVYQFGSFGGVGIEAWTVASNVGFTFSTAPWQPRIGLKANVASGDKSRSDGVLGTFNPLFPRLPYFTEAGLVAPANIMDLHPTLSLTPGGTLSVAFGLDILWRHRRADALYAPPLVPVNALATTDRFVGAQLEAALEWQATPQLEVKAWYVRSYAGSAVQAAGAQDTDFLAASIAWRF